MSGTQKPRDPASKNVTGSASENIGSPRIEDVSEGINDVFTTFFGDAVSGKSRRADDLETEGAQRRQVNVLPIKNAQAPSDQIVEVVAKVVRDLASHPDLLAQFLKGYTQALELLHAENVGE